MDFVRFWTDRKEKTSCRMVLVALWWAEKSIDASKDGLRAGVLKDPGWGGLFFGEVLAAYAPGLVLVL